MKSILGVVAILFTVCVFVVFVGGASADNATNTKPVNDKAVHAGSPTGRFQISSFAGENGAGSGGCYVIDSTTGEVWRIQGSASPIQVGGTLIR